MSPETAEVLLGTSVEHEFDSPDFVFACSCRSYGVSIALAQSRETHPPEGSLRPGQHVVRGPSVRRSRGLSIEYSAWSTAVAALR